MFAIRVKTGRFGKWIEAQTEIPTRARAEELADEFRQRGYAVVEVRREDQK